MAGTSGVAVKLNNAVYFIPEDDLASYRIPDAAAGPIRDGLAQSGDEVSGFASKPDKQAFAQISAAFSILPRQDGTWLTPFTSEDFITMSRVK